MRDITTDQNKQLTKNLSSSPNNLFWLSENQLAFDLDERGSSNVMQLNIANLKLAALISGVTEQFFLSAVNQKSRNGNNINPDRPGDVRAENTEK